MITGFLFGVLFTLSLLVAAVFYRRRQFRDLMDKIGRGGENSRENVGENVVAVLNGKQIRPGWIERVRRRFRGD